MGFVCHHLYQVHGKPPGDKIYIVDSKTILFIGPRETYPGLSGGADNLKLAAPAIPHMIKY